MEAIQEHEQGLSYRLIRGLTAMPGVHFYGIQDVERLDERVPTVAINLEGQVPQIVANTLAQRGIFCWAGHYYALEVIEELGLVPDGAVRLGLTHYNTEEEVDRILETLDGLRLA
jgi:selenocysteine lyase/cysteine desulfurase